MKAARLQYHIQIKKLCLQNNKYPTNLQYKWVEMTRTFISNLSNTILEFSSLCDLIKDFSTAHFFTEEKWCEQRSLEHMSKKLQNHKHIGTSFLSFLRSQTTQSKNWFEIFLHNVQRNTLNSLLHMHTMCNALHLSSCYTCTPCATHCTKVICYTCTPCAKHCT